MHRDVKRINKKEHNKQNYEQIEGFDHSNTNNHIRASYTNSKLILKTINNKPNNFNNETEEIKI